MAESNPPPNPDPPDPVPGATPGATSGASPADAAPATAAEQAVESVAQAADAVQAAVTEGAESPEFPELADDTLAAADIGTETAMNLLDDVSLAVKVELGRTHMYVEDVLRLNANSVIELNKAAGDHVDIFVNDRLVARGEVLVLNETFCIRVSEIVNPHRSEE